ncbi:MAG: hypothetical protein ACREF7_01380, partial [Candidatus Saccharimonadales bacterium]
TTPTLNQTINAGALTTNIYQSNDSTPVSSPSVAFSSEPYSFKCLTSTATLGDANDLVNVTNLANGVNTWTLSIAATGGDSATWSDGGGTYAYNDPTGSGCTNGQLSVDPSAATITDDCSGSCNNSTVTLGPSSAYNGSILSSATLMSDSSGSGWEGYLQGINLSQTIPALQAAGSYTLGMTITVTNT